MLKVGSEVLIAGAEEGRTTKEGRVSRNERLVKRSSPEKKRSSRRTVK